jgi:hypothetical protein
MPPVWSAAGGLVIVIFLVFVICHLEFLLLKPEHRHPWPRPNFE